MVTRILAKTFWHISVYVWPFKPNKEAKWTHSSESCRDDVRSRKTNSRWFHWFFLLCGFIMFLFSLPPTEPSTEPAKGDRASAYISSLFHHSTQVNSTEATYAKLCSTIAQPSHSSHSFTLSHGTEITGNRDNSPKSQPADKFLLVNGVYRYIAHPYWPIISQDSMFQLKWM